MAKEKAINRRRRQILKWSAFAGGSILAPVYYNGYRALLPAPALADNGPPTPFNITPFRVELPIPAVLQQAPAFTPGDVFHGIAPEFDRNHPDHDSQWNDAALKHYEVVMEQTTAQIIPGIDTPVFTYRDGTQPAGSGSAPGATILTRFNEPIVVRHRNNLTAANTLVEHDIETSVHLHGAHSPAHADGFPNFYVLPNRERDYYYPNIVPKRRIDGNLQFDASTIPSTMWYHDHGMDITGFNVSHGLAAFYLLIDDLEQGLIDNNVLPSFYGQFDIPIALTDQRFNADGTLFYDFFDHDGRIGDVFTVNGVAQPFFRVQRRKYRFRVLNASNARVYQLRLSTGQAFLQIGNDSWLLPNAVEIDGQTGFRLSMAERADLIIDFRNAPDELFLENIMFQPDGRGPKEVNIDKERTPLIKFIVEGANISNDISVMPGTALRPHDPIQEQDIAGTRTFEFVRRNGAWQINNMFFSPRRANAVPERDPEGIRAERWILKNKSNGWWHPIHIHLEHHEIQTLNGQAPPLARRFKSDVSTLSGNGEAEILMRFRTFTGPFVFHCHNLEHEDMRMMGVFDPRPNGQASPLNGLDEIDPAVSGVPLSCEALEPNLFFDAAGDLDRLEGRGVGIPCDDFEP